MQVRLHGSMDLSSQQVVLILLYPQGLTILTWTAAAGITG
jgi:hypothetical protein